MKEALKAENERIRKNIEHYKEMIEIERKKALEGEKEEEEQWHEGGDSEDEEGYEQEMQEFVADLPKAGRKVSGEPLLLRRISSGSS